MAPIYEFQNAAGDVREEFCHATTGPRIGDKIELDGEIWTRIISAPQLASSKGQENYRLHSEACPGLATIEHEERRARKLQELGHNVRMPVRAPAYDEVGRAVFKSPKELQDYCAKDGRYKVGSIGEIAQKAAQAPVELRKKQKAEALQREKLAKIPEVR